MAGKKKKSQDPSQLTAAIEAAASAINDEALWDEAESLAADLDSPDGVAAAYRDVLGGTISAEDAKVIGQRAASFHEEWFGQDAPELAQLLRRVLEIAPKSDWAFQRLSVSLTVTEKWDELLSLYDDTLASATKTRQQKLLDEAYQIAKDLAGNPTKAIEYLRRLYAITGKPKQAEALERLLEKHESWPELIEFLDGRIGSASGDQRPALRLRVARIYFDKLGDPDSSLETVRLLLAELGRETPDPAVGELLEQLATAGSASAQVRDDALNLLRELHESTGRADEIVRVVEAALPLADEQAQKNLHRDAAQRLAELGKHDEAIEHYAELLLLDPGSVVTQRALKQLAQASDRSDRYAEAAVAAAAKASDPARKVALLSDAARARLDSGDESGAIELFQRALTEPEIPQGDVLTVARRVDELLARAGRTADRLPILERLAEAESVPSSRQAIIGDIARLAEEQGETDRALDAWNKRLEIDPEDATALGAIIDLLDKEARWPKLVEALERRAALDSRHGQRRADMVRVARVLERELGDKEGAIAAWLRVADEIDGNKNHRDLIGALTQLYAETSKWRDLGELLDGSSKHESTVLTQQLIQLGDAHVNHLDNPELATQYFARALDIDSKCTEAREGLEALLEYPTCRGAAAEALGRSYRLAEDWPRYLSLVDARVIGTDDPSEKLRILREAAGIQERIGESRGALHSLMQAFPLAPKDRALEDQLIRLARSQDAVAEAVGAFRKAADALREDPHGAAQLRMREGELLEELGDQAGAHSAYFGVLSVDPANLEATRAVVRIGSRIGKWVEVAAAVIDCIRTRGRVDKSLLAEIDEAASENNSYDEMCKVISAAVDQGGLDGRIASELHLTVATWHRDRRADSDTAAASLRRAVELDASRTEALEELVALDERNPDRNLYDSLQRLADAKPNDLDVLHRAATLAADELGDRGLAKTSTTRLLGRATAAWRGTAPAEGNQTPQEYVGWAVGKLVDLHQADNEAQVALDLLVDASRLPFDSDKRAEFRHRAARLAEELDDTSGAIDMYRGLLAQRPDDQRAIDRLAELYKSQDRTAELLALRRHQLALPLDTERKLALRLELVSLIDDIDHRGGRLELLRANLGDEAGHDPSIVALTGLLEAVGKHRDLHDLLVEQAKRLEVVDKSEAAARLWAQTAHLAENQLSDADQAIAAHRRVIALAPTQNAYDALARLYMDKGEPAEAVPWLERALAGAEAGRQAQISLDLANAHIATDRRDRAIACLEKALGGSQGSIEVRRTLADLYRKDERWEPLADLLTGSLTVLDDEDEASAWSREASEIYYRRLNAPERALPALERALEHLPDDRSLRSMLAGSLRASGDTGRAREILESLIEDFGRRRSKERAKVHAELALVARAEGELEEAVSELEKASQMDGSNPHNLRLLAQLARESGKLDQAEKSLRALLLLVRRQPPGDDLEAVGLAEVLFELHAIAKQRGDDEKADELLESAMETAKQSDPEVIRLRRALLAHGAGEVLLRAVEARLSATEDESSRISLLQSAAEAHEMLDQPGKALDRLLEASEARPGTAELHDRALDMARKADQLPRYLEAATAELEQMRRQEDAPKVARLSMNLGALAEEAGELERAAGLYSVAHRNTDNPSDALFALSRVAGELGDTDTQTRAMDELAALTSDDEPTPERATALYRLASFQADQPEMVGRAMDLLERAMRIDTRHDEAAEILRKAAENSPDDGHVLDLYERVARGSGNGDVLLDYLERRIRQGGGEEVLVREAVELAREQEQNERAEVILRNAIEAARDGLGVAQGAVWAATALADLSLNKGELDEARDLLAEVGEVAEPDELRRLGLALAGRAVEADQLELAAETYETLRQRNPDAREVWEPLFDLRKQLGDDSALATLVEQTLPNLLSPGERNALRLRHARFLLERDRQADAIEVLRDAYLDDQADEEVAELLEQVLSEGGDDEALTDFLGERLESARERNNPDVVVRVALQLGGLLEQMGTGDPLSVYKQALDSAPDSRDLLRKLADVVPTDADDPQDLALLEKLLAVEEESRGAELAFDLCTRWERAGDPERAFHMLEIGHRTSPDNEELRERLAAGYREAGFTDKLVELLMEEGERTSDVKLAVSKMREASRVLREEMGDLHRAADALRRASLIDGENGDLVIEHASLLAAASQPEAAIEVLSERLDSGHDGDDRVAILMLRADLQGDIDREEESLASLEEANRLEPERAGEVLRSALDRRRESARQRGDSEGERTATMRLARMLTDAGHEVHARDLLVHWLEQTPTDEEALRLVLEMDSGAERWDGVVAVCARLVTLEVGQAQLDAAMRLAEAASKCNMEQVAQQGLEYVHQVQPEVGEIRELLRTLYEQSGSYSELAGLLLADAEHAEDDETRYQCYRQAADILVNQLGDTAAAVEPAQRARELKPDDHETLLLHADVMIASSQIREAVELLMPAIESHKRRSPELASLQYRMAKAAGSTGDRETQLAWLKRAFDVDRKDGNISAELAQLATELGDYDLALKPLRAITLNDTPGPITRVMALLWEAKIEHARGNKAKAELWAKKALREDPNFAEAEEFLTELAQSP